MATIVGDAAHYLNAHLAKGPAFGGALVAPLDGDARRSKASALMPRLHGLMEGRSQVGHFSDDAETLEFVGSVDFERLAAAGASCPDHFLRAKIATNASAYASAKAASVHLARSLGLEGAPSGIRFNTVNPDAVIKGPRIWDGDWRNERAGAHGIVRCGYRGTLSRPFDAQARCASGGRRRSVLF